MTGRAVDFAPTAKQHAGKGPRTRRPVIALRYRLDQARRHKPSKLADRDRVDRAWAARMTTTTTSSSQVDR